MQINDFFDMETPIRKLEEKQAEALIFLGKVGIGISTENLYAEKYSQYDGIFLVLDDEDNYNGKTTLLPQTNCVTIRFQGGHMEAPIQYQKLMKYIKKQNLTITGFSREITMIDYGLTNDPDKFVTEISIPAEKQ